MLKKLYAPLLLLLAVLTIGLWTVPAEAAIVASGECGASGSDLTWTLESVESGLSLIIRGTGEMYNYTSADSVPWASYRDQITKAEVGDGVANIGNNAFRLCTALTEVTLPATLKRIGDVAFYHCDSLKAIDLSKTTILDSIGNNAFGYCAITTIEIPATVTKIDDVAFYKCSQLSSITVAEGNTTYSADGGVLFNADKTTLIWFPAGSSLAEYTIPESVTTIGSYAFNGCEKLTAVTFPNNLERIEAWAFSYSTKLSTINNVPVTLTFIGDSAFYECLALGLEKSGDTTVSKGTVYYNGSRQQWKEVEIGDDNYRLSNSNIQFANDTQDNVIASGECGAMGSNASWSLNDEGLFTISGKDAVSDYGGEATVPWVNYSDGENKTDLRDQIKTLVINEGITSLGNYNFYNCANLESIVFPTTLKSIGVYTFSGCTALTKTDLTQTALQTVGNYAFNGCNKLTDIQFPKETLLTIGDRAFLRCAALTSVTVPTSVTRIGEWAFRWCNALETFTMATIGRNESTHYMSIGNYALADCTALKNVSLTNNLTVLGEYVFSGDTALTTVLVPASVSGIGICAFYNCPAITGIGVDSNNQSFTSLYGMLLNKEETAILYYPGGRQSDACEIPKSVTSVERFAFDGATLLKKAVFLGTKSQWENDVKPNIKSYNDPLLNAAMEFAEEDTNSDGNGTDISQVGKTEDGTQIQVIVACGENSLGAEALCVSYDADKRFLGIESKELEPGLENTLTYEIIEGATEVRVIVMDGYALPQCASKRYDLSA